MLFLLALTGCKIDLSIIGLGSVQSESGNYDCSGAGVDAGGQEINSGDCSHHYANTAAQCPGYIPPTGNNLPSIPSNCTVVLADVGSCAALYANSVEGVNCISNVAGEQDNGLAEILTPQAADGSDFVSWGDSLGCSAHAGVCSLWVNEARAGTDDEIEITASFEPEADLQNASYTYNHLGQRASKTTGGVTTHFVYSVVDGQLLGEYTGAGQPVRQYVYVDGERVAMLDYSSGSKQVVYLANNQVGQVVMGWDSAGEQVYERVQTPFGETMGELAVGGIAVPVRFPGQYYDAETGFNQNWFRTYDPARGAYNEPDPIGVMRDYSHSPEFAIAGVERFSRGIPAGINHVYGYVDSNPVVYIDFYGLEVSVCVEAGNRACSEGRRRCKQAFGMASLNTGTGFSCEIACDKCKKEVEEWCESNPDSNEPPPSVTDVKPNPQDEL